MNTARKATCVKRRGEQKNKTVMFTEMSRWDMLRSWFMKKIMRIVHGYKEEAEFQSFPWTIATFDLKENWWLEEADMAVVPGDPKACRKKRRCIAFTYWRKRFWRRNFVVIKPAHDVQPGEVWYLGWLTKNGYYVSKIPLVGPVRKLRYPDRTAYIGLGSDHKQLKVLKTGYGSLGESGNFVQYPLL